MVSVGITGLGVVSPLGFSVDELTTRFAGGDRAQPQAPGGECIEVSDVPLGAIPAGGRTRIGRLDRFCRFFLSASYLALDAARVAIAPESAERVGIVFGTGLGCLLTNEEYYRKIVESGLAAASPRLFAYTVSSAPAGEVSIALGIKGPNVTLHTGLAAGLSAIGYGLDLIQLGQADMVLAGGADAVGPALVRGLRDMRLLKTAEQAEPFRQAVAGVYPSEGAVVAILERTDHARARGAALWGTIEAYAAGFEPTLTAAAPVADGLVATMERSLALCGRRADEVDLVLCSAHGTPLDAIERDAIREVLSGRSDAIVLAPKAALGESFGASGALALALGAGLINRRSTLADGVAFGVEGSAVDGAMATARLRDAAVVMISGLCYSGNVVSVLLSGDA